MRSLNPKDYSEIFNELVGQVLALSKFRSLFTAPFPPPLRDNCGAADGTEADDDDDDDGRAESILAHHERLLKGTLSRVESWGGR